MDGDDETCYCDRGCHARGDCCSDILVIGCFGMQQVAYVQQGVEASDHDMYIASYSMKRWLK